MSNLFCPSHIFRKPVMKFCNYLLVIAGLIVIYDPAYLYAKENSMNYPAKNIQKNQKNIPALDLDKPQNLRTATFALG